MMKKITLLLFTILSTSVFAQTTNLTGLPGDDLVFYEDMRYIGGASGFTVTSTLAPVAPNGVAAIPAVGSGAGKINFTRPTTNYPVGDAIDNRSLRILSNNGSVNYDMDVWIVVNSIDLSAYDVAGTKNFTFAIRTQYREDGGTNVDTDNTIWYATDFTTGSDPTAISWTQITATAIGASADMGKDGAWTYFQTVDLSSVTCGTNFAIAIRRQCSANGPSGGAFSTANNRNGTVGISDLVYTASLTTASIEDDILKNGISVYPNPANGLINIRATDSNIDIKNVSLIDILGRTVYSSKNSKSIDVSSFTEGIYFLRLESNQGGVLSKKIVVN